MIRITVIRDAGDVLGEDIIDPLIVTEAMAIQRGRNEIDANAKIIPMTLESVHRAGVRAGQIIEVLDSLQGAAWRGKVISMDIAVEAPSITLQMQIERV